MMAAYEVDFGSVLDPDLYPSWHLPESDTARPVLGDLVFLYDHEGAACHGTVERIDDDFIWCRPVPGTWFTQITPPGPNSGSPGVVVLSRAMMLARFPTRG